MKKIKILAVILLIAGIGGWAVWKFYVQKQVKSNKNKKPDYTTTVQALFTEAADSTKRVKYIDKLVEVQGLIGEVLYSDSASVINITDSLGTNLIKCQIFNKDNDASIKNLQPKSAIKIKGDLTGFDIVAADPTDLLASLGSSIEMKNCVIVK